MGLNINKIEAQLCKNEFYYFVQYFWDTIIAEEPIWNWHIKYLCDELQQVAERVAMLSRGKDEKGKPLPPVRLPKEFDYILINVPPGSSKSTIVSEMYPLYCWTIDATQRFICGSYASTPAEDIAEKCFNIFNSEKFKTLFPEMHTRKTVGGKTHFKNGLKGERYTTSTGSAITGIHAHQLLIDDPMNPEIAASKVERTKANKWISETISSRKVSHETTVTIILMQRLHEVDTTGYILKKPGLKIKHICIPAELTEDVKPVELRAFYIDGLFDPIRRNKEGLRSAKAELGSYGYAGQMMQRPSPGEGGVVKKVWFNYIARSSHNATTQPIHFQIDTAFTEDTENDPTGVTAYYKENGNIYILNHVDVYKEFPELVKWLPTFARENGYTEKSMIRIEPKANGLSVAQQLKAGTKLNIKIDKAPKEDKLTRLHAGSPKIEAGRIFLHTATWNEDYVDQIASFPNAQHDEAVDNLSAIIRNELLPQEGKSLADIAGGFH